MSGGQKSEPEWEDRRCQFAPAELCKAPASISSAAGIWICNEPAGCMLLTDQAKRKGTRAAWSIFTKRERERGRLLRRVKDKKNADTPRMCGNVAIPAHFPERVLCMYIENSTTLMRADINLELVRKCKVARCQNWARNCAFITFSLYLFIKVLGSNKLIIIMEVSSPKISTRCNRGWISQMVNSLKIFLISFCYIVDAF